MKKEFGKTLIEATNPAQLKLVQLQRFSGKRVFLGQQSQNIEVNVMLPQINSDDGQIYKMI